MNLATKSGLYPRFLEERMLGMLANSPAVLLHGPRQCGKTTLARAVLEPRGYGYVNFDDPRERGQALNDLMGYVADLPEHVILDEVQQVPEIFAPLKIAIDNRRTPGRFLLTGSSHVLWLPKLSDSLAGRVMFLQLHPLSQGEQERRSSKFLDELFGGGFIRSPQERLGDSLREMVAKGGYPMALAQSTYEARKDWHLGNLNSVVFRDMEELFRIGQPGLLGRIMRQAAERTASVVTANGIARQLGSTMPTVNRYLGLLEQMFVLDLLPSWHRNRLRRQVKAPKLHLGDTGMACALISADAATLRSDRPLHGQLLETFVYQELRRQASWDASSYELFHFRHMDRAEVDIVIEGPSRAIAGVEVKAGSTVHPSDFKGLKMLSDAVGKDFVRGVVLYDGERSYRHKDKYYALPVRQVWETLSG